ncbi:MAG TPA: PAS domain-containing protein [Terriglobales bacterium]|nr:PAS domain-containing protein [Terriglobales bacterium]
MHLFPPTAVLFNKVALLMLVLSAVGLIVGSEVSERHRLAIGLNEQTTYLDSLIQNSPLGIVVLDRQGSVELVNSAFEKLFQCDRRQLNSIDIGSTWIPADEATDSAQLISQIFAGNALHRTVRRRRKDGQIPSHYFGDDPQPIHVRRERYLKPILPRRSNRCNLHLCGNEMSRRGPSGEI